MKTPQNARPTTTKRKTPPMAIVALGFMVVLALVWGSMALFGWLNTKSTANYAEEVAKPLEEGLVKAGGVKKSSYGEAGRVSDNRQPYYDAIYDLSTSKVDAIKIINKVAEDNGYKLDHATPTNRGFLGVADIYLDAWYFDTANKSSTFSDLERGSIRLSFKLGDEDTPDQAGHTTVRISIQLPGFKR